MVRASARPRSAGGGWTQSPAHHPQPRTARAEDEQGRQEQTRAEVGNAGGARVSGGKQIRMSNFRALTLALAAIAVAVIAAAPARPAPALAISASIKITPASQGVAVGGTAVVTVTVSSDETSAGAEISLSFDPTLVQIEDVQLGPAYAGASSAFGVVPGGDTAQAGQPQTALEAAAEANQTGTFLNAAAFFPPGTGTVSAGENAFLVLTMRATAPAGTSPIVVLRPQMLDEGFNPVVPSSADGELVIGGATAPVATSTVPAAAGATVPAGGATATAPATTKTVAATGTVLSAVKAPSLKSATFAISPATLKVAKEATFTFAVTQQVDGAASSAQADVSFKKDLLEIVKLEAGPGWKGDAKALDAAMTDANSSGELKVTLLADKEKGPATSGESTILTVTMKGRPGKEGKSAIKLVTSEIVGTDGTSPDVTAKDGEVVVGSAGGGSNALPFIIAALAAVVLVGGGGAAFYMRRAKGA